MIKPGPATFVIYQGAALDLPLLWSVGDPLEPVDLTGYSAYMDVRSDRKLDASLLISFDSTNSSIVFDPSAKGVFSLRLSMAQTAALNFEKGYGDLILVPPNGMGIRLVQFTVLLSAGTSAPRTQ